MPNTVSAAAAAAAAACVRVQVVTETELRPVWEGRDSMQGISELDYSPDGKLLAAATFDAWIDVYNAEKGYQRIGKQKPVTIGWWLQQPEDVCDCLCSTVNCASRAQSSKRQCGNACYVWILP
jgi:hypothetical protein